MRAITLSLVLAAASASADMPLQRGDTYSVWLAHDGQCLGSPSSKVALYTLIEERTLVSLLDKRDVLAEQGRAWLRKNHPDAR